MAVFALYSHQDPPWVVIGAGGLLLAAAAMIHTGFGQAGPAAVLGLDQLSARPFTGAGSGLALGAALGLSYRYWRDLPLLPATPLEPFVALACLIGAAEELIYRGWLLGQARRLGWPIAVTGAALAHAAYKTALFAWPAAPAAFDLVPLALLTFAGGIAFGLLRIAFRSLIPAILAHVAFDFVVYRSFARAPWWVWN